MAVRKVAVENTKSVKKSLEKSELQPYDILPNFDTILALKLLKAAKYSGASINDETIKKIEECVL